MKINPEKSKFYSFRDPMKDLYMCGALFVGKRGYFSDYPNFFGSIEGVLERVDVSEEHGEDTYYPFKMESKADVAEDIFKYFCPAEYAIGTPELRPYRTLDELPFKIGDSVTFREKNEHDKELMLTCSGIVVRDESELSCVHLGAYIFELDDLLEEYELFNGKEWKPFGVEA